MKKLLIISMALMLALVFGNTSFAQSGNQGYGAYTGLTQIGIKAGADASRTYGSDSRVTTPGVPPVSTSGPSWQFKGGFIGGAYARYNFTEAIAVQPEVLFAMYGSRRNIAFDGATNYRTLFNYVEIPIMLDYSFTTNTGNFRPNIFAGPTADFLVSAKQRADMNGTTVTSDVKDQLHSALFGVAIGAGLSYPMSSGKLTLDARYNLGITKIYKTTPLANTAQPNLRNSAIALMLGYSFR
jgi:hypothetical protein